MAFFSWFGKSRIHIYNSIERNEYAHEYGKSNSWSKDYTCRKQWRCIQFSWVHSSVFDSGWWWRWQWRCEQRLHCHKIWFLFQFYAFENHTAYPSFVLLNGPQKMIIFSIEANVFVWMQIIWNDSNFNLNYFFFNFWFNFLN